MSASLLGNICNFLEKNVDLADRIQMEAIGKYSERKEAMGRLSLK